MEESMALADPQSPKAWPWWSYEASFGTWFGLALHITAGGLAGMVAGFLVGGIGSRLFMRIAGAASGSQGAGRVTEAGFTVGEVSPIGTFFLILFIGIASGIVGAGMYLVMQPWLGWAHRWRGAAFGIVLFALTSATSDLMNPDNRDFSILGNGLLLVALMVGLFVAFGVVVDLAFRRFDTLLQAEEEVSKSDRLAFGIIAAAVIVLVVPGILLILLDGERTCSCETPVLASWSFLVLFISTAVVWIGAIVRFPSWLLRIAAVTGYLGIGSVTVFGLVRALSDAKAIIG
jgi:hypothetical protein